MTPKRPSTAGSGVRRLPVSVIICAYTTERWSDLLAAVESVSDQSVQALETIVVIDRCPELLQLAETELQGVSVLANGHAGGLSGSRQTGADHARGEVLAFLDDDAVADVNWLAELLPAYEDPAVLGAGGAVEPWWLEREPDWFPPEFLWVVGCSHSGMPRRTTEVRNLIGANMSMRAGVLGRAGGFQPRLGRAYGDGGAGSTAEETELCIRASRLHPGGTWVYIPSARVMHRVPASRTTFSYFLRRCQMEGRAKAVIAGLEGRPTALEAESSYVRSVLARAVARDLRSAIRGRAGALASAGAIGLGLLATALTYGHTIVTGSRRGTPRLRRG